MDVTGSPFSAGIRMNVFQEGIRGDSTEMQFSAAFVGAVSKAMVLGECHLPEARCALEKFFSEIVRRVSSVRSSLLENHAKATRYAICAQCFHRLPNGYCLKRTRQVCSLDRCFPTVVETIEAVQRSILRID